MLNQNFLQFILSFVDEPIAVSLILGNFNRDVVVRNQIITMMQREQITEVLTAKQDRQEWFDYQIPAHLKRMKMPYGQKQDDMPEAHAMINGQGGIFSKVAHQNLINLGLNDIVEINRFLLRLINNKNIHSIQLKFYFGLQKDFGNNRPKFDFIQKPQSQMTVRSGETQNRPAIRNSGPLAQLSKGNIQNYDPVSRDIVPLMQNVSRDNNISIGLTAHNLQLLDKPKPVNQQGQTKQNFVQNFLNQMETTDRQKVQNRMRAVSNLRGPIGGPTNLNNIDANLDLVPFDSVSNPNKSVRYESVGRQGINKKLGGVGLRPEMDSFYKDREDIRQRQLQQLGRQY